MDAMTTRSPACQSVGVSSSSCVLPAVAVERQVSPGRSRRLACSSSAPRAVHGDHLRWRVGAGIVAGEREHHPVSERCPLGSDASAIRTQDVAGGQLEIAIVGGERAFDPDR